MNKTSAQDLSEKIKQRSVEKQVKELAEMEKELNDLINSIRKLRAAAVSTIENAMAGLTVQTIKNLRRIWFYSFLVGAAAIIGIGLAGYGTSELYLSKIESLQEKIRVMELRVQDLKKQGGKIKIADCGNKKRKCAAIEAEEGSYGKNGEYRILKGY